MLIVELFRDKLHVEKDSLPNWALSCLEEMEDIIIANYDVCCGNNATTVEDGWRIWFHSFQKKNKTSTRSILKKCCKTHYYQIKVKPNIMVLFFKKQSE